jgi:adenine deaminase
MNNQNLKSRIQAAQGIFPCDLTIENVTYLDVFSCTWRTGSVSWIDGVIVGLESGLKAKRTINGRGKFLVPGFIDAHVHVESSLLTPKKFQTAVLPKGTTTAICDPHELTNVLGTKAFDYFLSESLPLHLDLRVMMSSCIPATHLETNGAGELNVHHLTPYLDHPKVLGLAEMMNVPGVLNGDPLILDKLEAFTGRPLDGHCPMVTGKALAAYASARISSCHESSELSEAEEKLRNGISVWIREGSVAKDLKALSPLLNLATSTSVGFCTDDRNPLEIATEGHLDYLIRKAIQYGVIPEVAYRAASWSVARHYGLRWKGAIAPGYEADLVLLNDATTCEVAQVFIAGAPVNELPEFAKNAAQLDVKTIIGKDSIHAHVPELSDLEAPVGQVNVIGIQNGKILTDHLVLNSNDPAVARLSVIERHGKGYKPANAYVKGFGTEFKGAISSSVGHDSHNLIVAGKNTKDMQIALKALIDSGGGFCVVKDGNVLAHLELPLGGLMSEEEPEVIAKSLRELRKASLEVGCDLHEPFLQLAFLSLPVIPSLKLTDLGLVDVNAFNFIPVKV